ncbi:hypothetical protein K2173_028462 [Erythroxylum novogranatense]|uniref:BSD domain-containing protein n=1 Tax=Erythroxylum novogranatense TaxID=1862640 RepID=A0AAV8U4M7_9ROSI|nr:hypothetical protein K2173_028462 [Erythroxylum novogranatense]
MSWLARSLANSLRLDEDDSPDNDVVPTKRAPTSLSPTKCDQQEHSRLSFEDEKLINEEEEEDEDEEALGRGVKEDLTELKQTLTRQLWGVASFLAPQPTPSDRFVSDSEACDRSDFSDERVPAEGSGIKTDFTEIGGRFRSGVTEMSKMASNYFQFGSGIDEGECESEMRGECESEMRRENEDSDTEESEECRELATGITDEVLAFARNIAMHPETWLDFPLDEEDDLDDFEMSSPQQEHALAIEHLAPRLAALRFELCPCHMTESYFWKVYFVLLHSRLNRHDAEILSTPQVMEARAMWMQELHKKMKPESDWFAKTTSSIRESSDPLHEDFAHARAVDFEQITTSFTDYESEKLPVVSTEMQFVDKSVIEEKEVIKKEDKSPVTGQSSRLLVPNYEEEEEDDDWPDEDDSDLGGYKSTIPLGNEEEISFSDLEDDDGPIVPIKSK